MKKSTSLGAALSAAIATAAAGGKESEKKRKKKKKGRRRLQRGDAVGGDDAVERKSPSESSSQSSVASSPKLGLVDEQQQQQQQQQQETKWKKQKQQGASDGGEEKASEKVQRLRTHGAKPRQLLEATNDMHELFRHSHPSQYFTFERIEAHATPRETNAQRRHKRKISRFDAPAQSDRNSDNGNSNNSKNNNNNNNNNTRGRQRTRSQLKRDLTAQSLPGSLATEAARVSLHFKKQDARLRHQENLARQRLAQRDRAKRHADLQHKSHRLGHNHMSADQLALSRIVDQPRGTMEQRLGGIPIPQYRQHCDLCPYKSSPHTLSQRERWRLELHLFLEDPDSSQAARMGNLLIVLAIIVSTVSFVLETMPELASWSDVWPVIEVVVVTIFSLEYALRLFATADIRAFHMNWMNLVDIMAILPFFVDKLFSVDDIGPLRVLRTIRLVRLFRIFRFPRYSQYASIIGLTIKKSRAEFAVMSFFVTLCLIIMGSIFFYADRGDQDLSGDWVRADGEVAPYQSIIGAFWIMIQTLTSEGYGTPNVPVSTGGKFVASVAAVLGILVMAMPMTIMGAHFVDSYHEKLSEDLPIVHVLRDLYEHECELKERVHAGMSLVSPYARFIKFLEHQEQEQRQALLRRKHKVNDVSSSPPIGTSPVVTPKHANQNDDNEINNGGNAQQKADDGATATNVKDDAVDPESSPAWSRTDRSDTVRQHAAERKNDGVLEVKVTTIDTDELSPHNGGKHQRSLSAHPTVYSDSPGKYARKPSQGKHAGQQQSEHHNKNKKMDDATSDIFVDANDPMGEHMHTHLRAGVPELTHRHSYQHHHHTRKHGHRHHQHQHRRSAASPFPRTAEFKQMVNEHRLASAMANMVIDELRAVRIFLSHALDTELQSAHHRAMLHRASLGVVHMGVLDYDQ